MIIIIIQATARLRCAFPSGIIRIVPVRIRHCRALLRLYSLSSGRFLYVPATVGLSHLHFQCQQDGSYAYPPLKGSDVFLSGAIRISPVIICHCRALAPLVPVSSGWFLCVSVTEGFWCLPFQCYQDRSCASRLLWRILCAPFPWLEDRCWAYQPLWGSYELRSSDSRMVPVSIRHYGDLMGCFPLTRGWFLWISRTAGLWRASFSC